MNKPEAIVISVAIICITVLIILFAGEPDIADAIVNIDKQVVIRQNRVIVK